MATAMPMTSAGTIVHSAPLTKIKVGGHNQPPPGVLQNNQHTTIGGNDDSNGDGDRGGGGDDNNEGNNGTMVEMSRQGCRSINEGRARVVRGRRSAKKKRQKSTRHVIMSCVESAMMALELPLRLDKMLF